MAALEHAEHRIERIQFLAHLHRVRPGGDHRQRLDRRDRLPRVGDKLIVRMTPDFLQVAGCLEKLTANLPPPARDGQLRFRRKSRFLPNRIERIRQLADIRIHRPVVLRSITHQRRRTVSKLAAPVGESARRAFDTAVEFGELCDHPPVRLVVGRERLRQRLAMTLELQRENLRPLLALAAGAHRHRREDFLDHLRLRNRDAQPSCHRRPLRRIIASRVRHFHQPLLLTVKDEPVLREDCRLFGQCDRLGLRARSLRAVRDFRARLDGFRHELARHRKCRDIRSRDLCKAVADAGERAPEHHEFRRRVRRLRLAQRAAERRP